MMMVLDLSQLLPRAWTSMSRAFLWNVLGCVGAEALAFSTTSCLLLLAGLEVAAAIPRCKPTSTSTHRSTWNTVL